MVTGVHAMFYSRLADEDRAFLRDKVGLPFVDTGGGWLIFAVKTAEVGCHPSENTSQDFSFVCDDLYATVEELQARGVPFTREIRDDGFGLTTEFQMPGGMVVTLYEPRYKMPAWPSS